MRLVNCIGTNADNIRPAQRALQYFKHPNVLAILLSKEMSLMESGKTIGQASLSLILPALYRQGQLSWNPTVNKMTALALKNLMEYDLESFRTSCNTFFTPSSSLSLMGKAEAKGSSGSAAGVPRPHQMLTKKDDRPVRPPSAASANSNNNPNSLGMMPPAPTAKYMATLEKGKQPPSTITGVAPWAMSKTTSDGEEKEKEKPIKSFPPPHAIDHKVTVSTPIADGFHKILSHMKSCYQYLFDESQDPHNQIIKSWNTTQAAIQPLLLPDLKFHDLVFGQVLGEGAFSVVKYTRHITKGKTQSSWPEYAVKIIDTEKLVQYNYSLSVIREIAVLKILVHPNIARMISAFRYQNAGYLVLEYASRGDLHSFLLKHGKLEHALIR